MLKLEQLSFDVKEEKGTKKILSNINPVSYTHLDVYKRQIYGSIKI